METSFFISHSSASDLQTLTVLQQMGDGTSSLGYKVRLHGRLHFMKRLKPEFLHDPSYQLAFRKEFLTGYNLQHPNLVNYYRLEEDADGIYMLTEYVEGDTLLQVLKNNPDYFCDKKNLMDFVGQLFDVFRYLHANQVLYLDLKPDNLMLTHIDNRLKLVDLGCCKTDSFDYTAGRNLMFAAPEQKEGDELDARTDIYAIGQLIQYVVKESGAKMPGKLKRIVSRCSQEDKNRRYASIEEIKWDEPRNMKWWIAAAVAVVAGFVLSFTMASRHSDQELPLYDFELDGIYYKVLSQVEGTCAVTRKDRNFQYSDYIRIPDEAEYLGTKYKVVEIADSAFYYSTPMPSVIIPNSVRKIGNYAFSYCEGLSSLILPESVEEIGEGAMDFCVMLNVVDVQAKIREVPANMFSNCFNLVQVEFPEGVESLGTDAFGNCINLQEVKLPSTLKHIGRGAFWHCYRLPEITIPKQVNQIDDFVFRRCDSLSVVYNQATEPQNITKIFSSALKKPLKVVVPRGSASLYQQASYWKDYPIVEQ